MNHPIQWTKEPIGVDEVVIRQANRISDMYGATRLTLPHRPATSRYKLMDIATTARAKPIGWRVKGVLPTMGIAAIYGPSGSAKTFLALDLAMAIANGLPWFGKRTKACPVVYVCLEGEAGLSNRLRAYLLHKHTGGECYTVTQPLDLLKDKDAPELAKAIMEIGAGNGLVIVDTLNRAAPGIDENSSVDMGKAIAMLKGLQQAINGLILVVHHTGKDASKGLRGHSSLHAALDAAIEVTRNGEQRSWVVAKSKDGEDGAAHPFKLEVVEMGLDQDEDPITSCVIQQGGEPAKKPLTPALQRGMVTFHAAANAGRASLEDWRAAYYLSSTGDTVDAKKKSFLRIRNQLVELGQLTASSDIYSLPTIFETLGGHGP